MYNYLQQQDYRQIVRDTLCHAIHLDCPFWNPYNVQNKQNEPNASKTL
jgi:hypothetical protein